MWLSPPGRWWPTGSSRTWAGPISKYPPDRSDRELYNQGYNRIYDTLEMEANLDYAEEVVREVLEKLDRERVWASSSLCRELGRHLAGQTEQPGLLPTPF